VLDFGGGREGGGDIGADMTRKNMHYIPFGISFGNAEATGEKRQTKGPPTGGKGEVFA